MDRPGRGFVKGNPLIISDPLLYEAFQKNLGHGIADTKELRIYEGDLSLITSLEIDQPVTSMEGLDLCNHLKRLVIQGSPGLALDAGPLGNLSGLRILEWKNGTVINQESLGLLNRLSELRFRQTPLSSLGFIGDYDKLMKFEYSDAPEVDPEMLTKLPLLEDLVLSRINLADAGFISRMPGLLSLDLSGNRLTVTDFLSNLSSVARINLSANRITRLLLTDQLQSLRELDVSGNLISGINISTELNQLRFMDLSDNRLATPGRLFLYTPALVELDLSNNRLRDMGRQRCQNLEMISVANNMLITTDWVSLQPRLKRVDLEKNAISDLSGLLRNNLFRQLDFLGLDRNPVSKQSFLEWLPILRGSIDTVSAPDHFQPLSPCYLSPASGSRLTRPEVELGWVADNSSQSCLYDLFLVKGDSLVPWLNGISSNHVLLNQRPSAMFSWVVASRTADSVYYSGVNDLVSNAGLVLPYIDGFEEYRQSEPLSSQSEFWCLTGEIANPGQTARVVSSTSRYGLNSLELPDSEVATLPLGHLDLPYLSIRFSILVPPGTSGEFRIKNMNGTYLRLVWDPSDLGSVYYNEKLCRTFNVDHYKWMDCEIMAHAINNSLFVRVAKQLVINEPWKVPEGVICAESIEFESSSNGGGGAGGDDAIYIDEVRITSACTTSDMVIEQVHDELVKVFPNPFAERISISFPSQGSFLVTIIDITGREICRRAFEVMEDTTVSLELPGLSPGIYTLCTGIPGMAPVRIVRGEVIN
jgi:Leucine-rich repeat (LRR) protein